MKIVIVGAGIAGLSTYLFLRKHLSNIPGLEIKIYEGYDISRYVNRISSEDGATTVSAKAQTEAEIAARSNLTEEGFNVEAIGAAIGIAKNGLDVLSRLFTTSTDTEDFASVLEEMVRQGYPITRWEMSCARGWVLGDVTLTPKAWRGKEHATTLKEGRKDEAASGSDQHYDPGQGGKNEWWQDSPISVIMIGRQAFWSIFLRNVVKVAGTNVIEHKRISKVSIPTEQGVLPQLKFADGSTEEVDLVIGADGLRSAVRQSMFGPASLEGTAIVEESKPSTSSDPSWLSQVFTAFSSLFNVKPEPTKDYVTPHYEGLVGVGGFVPTSILQGAGHKPGTMSIVFGPNGFFGHGHITSQPASTRLSPSQAAYDPNASSPGPVSVYWSTFSSPVPYPYALPSNSSSKPKPYDFDRLAARSTVLSRHRKWKNPAIQAILNYIETQTETQPEGFYPTYTTPELPTWTDPSHRVVLVGDAAHALQPSSGQGACQALEDAEALALFLQHSLSNNSNHRSTDGILRPPFSSALHNYETVRMPRVHMIYERSQKMSGMKADMGFLMEMMMYTIIKVMTFFHDDYNEKLVEYDLPKEVASVLKGTGS